MTLMGVLETIIAGIITAVSSSLILEWIRETRKNGKQKLEKIVDFLADLVKYIIRFFREAL